MRQDIKKIVTKFLNNESIAFDLIQYFKQEDFEKEIIGLADNAIIKSYNVELSLEEKALVVVAITVIALRYYDGNLWDHIRDLFSNTYSRASEQKADAKIRSILQLFKKDCNYKDSESLVAVPLVAAGVTHYWLQPFFDFCFEIYKANLLVRRDIEETELRGELLNTFEAMKMGNHLSDREDIIRIGKTHSYKLSRYTQSALLTGTNLEGITNIGTYCVKSIIKCLNDESFTIHPYYEDAFKSWKENFYSNKGERAKLTDSGNWKIKIKYENSKFYLITKTEKIPENTNPDNVVIQLLEDGIVISETSDVTVNFAIGGYLVDSKLIEIPCSLLNRISYRIVDGNQILFDSEDKIYKNNEVFFFDDKGNQVFSNSDFNGVLTVVTRTEINPSYSIRRGDDYFVSELSVTPSGFYNFDGKNYSFKTIRKPGIDGEAVSGVLAHTNIDNQDYEIYSNISSLLIETKFDKSELYLVIDGKDFSSFQTIEHQILDNGVRQYEILMPALAKGFHLVSVNSRDNKRPISKGSFAFVYDSNFKKEVRLNKNGSYNIHLSSSFVTDIKTVNHGVSCVYFQCVISGKGNGYLKVNPEIISLCFDGKWFKSGERIKYSKIKDISCMIRLAGPKNMKASAFTNKSVTNLQIYPNKEKNDEFLLDIGPALALKGSDVPNVKICISNNENTYDIYVDFATFIDVAKSEIRYDQVKDSHYFKFTYDEDKQITCKIFDVLFEKIVSENLIHSNTPFFPNNLRAFTNYKIVLTEKGEGMFAKDIVVCELPYFFVNSRDLVGKVFDIDTIEIYNENDNLIKKHLGSDGTTLKIFNVNKNDENSFVGSLRRFEYGENQLGGLGLLKISTDSEFEGDGIWIYIYDLEDEDLLLYDSNNGNICWTNKINSVTKKFPGIERYLIKVR